MKKKSTPPSVPPSLVAMGERKTKFEAEREVMFPKWKKALEDANGCVTYAATNFDPPMTRDKGNRLTRRFKLVEYAAELRAEATGHAAGRQDR